MKAWFFAFGIMLLLIGLPMMVVSSSSWSEPYTKIVEFAGRNEKPASWEIAAHFEEGDSIVIDYRQDVSWAEPPFEFSDEFPDTPLKLLYLNLTDPKGDNILFAVTLGQISGQTLLGQMKIEVLRELSSSDCLNVSDYPEKIAGVVKYTGTYKVVVLGPAPSISPPEPPWFLSFSKEYLQTWNPLSFLLPVGAIFALVGTGLTAWSTKGSKHRIRHKVKKDMCTTHKGVERRKAFQF